MESNRTYFCRIILSIFFVLNIVINISAQNKTESPISINILVEKTDENSLRGVTGNLYEKNKLVSTINSDKDGAITFKLNVNSEYTIEISKQEYVTKIVEINTNIPKYEKGTFEIAFPMLLFVPCEGLDVTVLKSPVVKLIYNDLKRDFLPDKTYDKVMVDKLAQLMKNNETCIEEKYNSIVRKADRQFDEKKYEESLLTYNKALDMRPDDEYVKNRISEINKILSQSKTNDKLYNDYIAQADMQFNNKRYALAKEFYKRALGLKPSEPYPQNQIDIIDKLLAEKNKEDQDKLALEARFKQLMSQGDNGMVDDICGKAVPAYNEALKLKPDDLNAKQKAADADKKCKDIQAKALQDKNRQDKYNAAIANGDKLLQSAKYEDARKSYQDALSYMPESDYPQKQVKLIDEKINKINKDAQDQKAAKDKEQDANYKNYIKQGDLSMNDDACGKALQSYKDALAIKPGDVIAQQKINEANSKCKEVQANAANLKKQKENYDAKIMQADNFFKAANYNEAKKLYQEALNIDPKSEYAANQLKTIDDNIKRLAKEAETAQKNKDKEAEIQYRAFIKQGDKLYDSEDLANAKIQYQKALEIKPNEQYPQEKIKTIDNILAEQLRLENEKKAKQAQYDKVITTADAAFKNKKYDDAKTSYIEANKILPSEAYPKQKIDEIDDILKSMATQKERDYALKIQSGDKNFAAKNYTQARQDYLDALNIKNDAYPTQRISDIDKILAEQAKLDAQKKAKQDAYNTAIAKADNQFKSQQYDNALISYKEASSYLPDEKYPYTKIDEINKIKKQQELDNNYKQAITTADGYFQKKQFEPAKTSYTQALNYKPNDQYALSQIEKANKEIADQLKKLADQKAKQDAYDKAVADGDKAFNIKDYDNSKTSYQTALAIFADKAYPKQKIDEIDKIQKQLALDKNYKQTVDEADQLFSSKNYTDAKAKYQDAGKLKPAETYPPQKIKEIDNILAQKEADKQKQLQTEKSYNEAVTKGNDLFDKAQYDAAKKEFERALTFMPDENYPKMKIASINEIKSLLAKEAAKAKSGTGTGTGVPVTGAATGVDAPKIADLKFNNNNEREQYLKELLAKYPEGITCEVYKETKRTITRYIIVRNNQANDFREIKHNWGGIDYTRNDKPITKLYFDSQVKSREGEYFSKTEL